MDFEVAGVVVKRSLEDVKAARPLVEVVAHAIDPLAEAYPAAIWDGGRNPDFGDEVESTAAALREAIETHRPPGDLSGGLVRAL